MTNATYIVTDFPELKLINPAFLLRDNAARLVIESHSWYVYDPEASGAEALPNIVLPLTVPVGETGRWIKTNPPSSQLTLINCGTHHCLDMGAIAIYSPNTQTASFSLQALFPPNTNDYRILEYDTKPTIYAYGNNPKIEFGGTELSTILFNGADDEVVIPFVEKRWYLFQVNAEGWQILCFTIAGDKIILE